MQAHREKVATPLPGEKKAEPVNTLIVDFLLVQSSENMNFCCGSPQRRLLCDASLRKLTWLERQKETVCGTRILGRGTCWDMGRWGPVRGPGQEEEV